MFVMAAVAVFFVSCGSKNAQQAENAEAQTEEVVNVEEATAELAAQLEAGDVNKFQEALDEAKAKAAELLKENPEQAKQYLEGVQNYLKENTEKIKELAGDNELVNTAVNTLVETPAESILSNLQTQLGNVEDAANAKVAEQQAAAEQKVEEGKQAVENTVNDVKAAAQQKADEAKAAAQQKADETKHAAANKVNEAASKANEQINKGADKLLKGAGLK